MQQNVVQYKMNIIVACGKALAEAIPPMALFKVKYVNQSDMIICPGGQLPKLPTNRQ